MDIQVKHRKADITPNVVIVDARVRAVANVALGVAGTGLMIVGIVDAAIPEIDLAFITVPAVQIVGGIAALFGLAVTLPNVPR